MKHFHPWGIQHVLLHMHIAVAFSKRHAQSPVPCKVVYTVHAKQSSCETQPVSEIREITTPVLIVSLVLDIRGSSTRVACQCLHLTVHIHLPACHRTPPPAKQRSKMKQTHRYPEVLLLPFRLGGGAPPIELCSSITSTISSPSTLLSGPLSSTITVSRT